MEEIRILGIYLNNRLNHSVQLQEVLTKYGCYIKTRLGLHEVSSDFCSSSGLIILELFGDVKMQDEMESALMAIKDLDVQKMAFKK